MSCYNFETVIQRTYQNRLEQTMFSNTLGQSFILRAILYKFISYRKLGRPNHLHFNLLNNTSIDILHGDNIFVSYTYVFSLTFRMVPYRILNLLQTNLKKLVQLLMKPALMQ